MPKQYGPDSIHRPDVFGSGDVDARHAAALARARAERGDRPGPRRLTSEELTEAMETRGRANAAARAEARATTPGGTLEGRLDAQQHRRNAQHALLPLITRFEDHLPAALGDVAEVTEWAADAAGGGRDWLVILGPTGVGKTWQAVAAYKAVTHDLGAEGQAIGCTELFMRSLPSAPDRLDLRPFEDADVLLLDDLTGELSDWDRKVLLRLIDARAARLTIITSNLDASEVRPALGGRIASRLSKRLRTVVMEGPDRRTGRWAPPEEDAPAQRLPYKD
jgi:chromosomal replication initiation ATPase DnaA